MFNVGFTAASNCKLILPGMLEFKYKKSSAGWPIWAETEGQKLLFTGTFEKKRVHWQAIGEMYSRILDIGLWGLVAVAILSLSLNIYLSVVTQSFLLFFQTNNNNLLLWFGVLSGLFLWARAKQFELSEQGANVLAQTVTDEAELDVYELFSAEAKHAWNEIPNIASNTNASEVNGVHIFLALLQSKSMQQAFARLGTDPRDVEIFLHNFLQLGPMLDDHAAIERLPFVAYRKAKNLHNKSIDSLMLLCALVELLPDEHIVQGIFFNLGISPEDLEILAAWIFSVRLLVDGLKLFRKLSRFKPDNSINRGLTSLPTYYLDHFSKDLTSLAKHGGLPLALGRAENLQELFNMVEAGAQNIVIKGYPGTGRTTLINELAYKMATEAVPKEWQDKRLVRLELSAIVGATGRVEQVLLECLHEARKAGNIILVLEDLEQLVHIQSSQGLSLLDILVDFLSQNDVPAIATTTLEAYTENLQPVGNFDQNFSAYELPQLSRKQALLACCIRASLLEAQYKIFFLYQALGQAYELSNVYIQNQNQPQKTIAVLIDAAAAQKNAKNRIISEREIQNVLSKKTHIPTKDFDQNESEKLLHLEEEIGKYVVGQKAAVLAVAEGLRRARSGLASSQRPVASFLFLGPTGVGKTELAKTLAKTYFGKSEYLLRLDMSEYSGAGAVEKIIGTAGGESSLLAKHIKNFPFCLLLCDEFEKASPEVQNLFLQILDDGRLSTGGGETLDLTHSMVIATSNAGTPEIQAGMKMGKNTEAIQSDLFNNVLPKLFKPELLNRFDGVIVFTPLLANEIEQITLLQLGLLKAQLYEKGIKIDFGKNLVKDISKKAFDPLLGGRPVRRYLQDHLEGFIARKILGKELVRGSSAMIDIKDGELFIK